jgi:hypothetical protein
VTARARQHPDAGPQRRGGAWLIGALAAACWGAAGCANFWDEVTSRDFKFDHLIHPPDPLVVLQNSSDGDQRRKALGALREPLANGGTQREQDLIVTVLTHSATRDDQALCRLAAIDSLRRFRDPRAAEALKEAYYRAGSFNAETATVIRCQALTALGEVGHPSAVELLVRVLREPPVEGADPEKQQKLDERIAAARALGHFPHYQATGALVEVMRGEQEDVALRSRAHESLQLATGKSLPADPQAWSDLLQHAPTATETAVAGQPGTKDGSLRQAGWTRSAP